MPEDTQSPEQPYFKDAADHEHEHRMLLAVIEKMDAETFALRHVVQALMAMEEARNPGFKTELLSAVDEVLGRFPKVRRPAMLVELRASLRDMVEEPNVGDMLTPPEPFWKRLLRRPT